MKLYGEIAELFIGRPMTWHIWWLLMTYDVRVHQTELTDGRSGEVIVSRHWPPGPGQSLTPQLVSVYTHNMATYRQHRHVITRFCWWFSFCIIVLFSLLFLSLSCSCLVDYFGVNVIVRTHLFYYQEDLVYHKHVWVISLKCIFLVVFLYLTLQKVVTST